MTEKPTDDRASPDQKVRRFFLPFVYGITTVNFIAVIQLVSSPQLRVDWRLLNAGEPNQILPLTGFVGMILMIASIPILVGCGLYNEFVVLFKGHVPRIERTTTMALVFFLGLLGLPITLVSFHPAFGIAFVVAVVVSATSVHFALKRLMRNDPRP